MKKKFFSLIGAGAAIVLLGQGCQATQQTETHPSMEEPSTPSAQIDASVDAIMNDAEASAAAEADASADAEVFNEDHANLDAFSQTQYEVK